jgi:uncharacterized protein YneF (UPF0154 family)
MTTALCFVFGLIVGVFITLMILNSPDFPDDSAP